MYRNFVSFIALAVILIAGCSKKQADEIKPTSAPETPGAEVTYNGFVQVLFQSKCASCHAPGRQVAPVWTFNGYSSVTTNASRIKQQVLVTKAMPVGSTISAADLKSLQEWFDKGMPQ